MNISIKKILKNVSDIIPFSGCINLGGGNWFFRGWKNIDFYADEQFMDYKIDFNKKESLPFTDNSIKVIFCSHVLYYLYLDSCKFLLEESYRILKQGGVIHLDIVDSDKDGGKFWYEKATDNPTGLSAKCFLGGELLRDMLLDIGFTSVICLDYSKSKHYKFNKHIFYNIFTEKGNKNCVFWSTIEAVK